MEDYIASQNAEFVASIRENPEQAAREIDQLRAQVGELTAKVAELNDYLFEIMSREPDFPIGAKRTRVTGDVVDFSRWDGEAWVTIENPYTRCR